MLNTLLNTALLGIAKHPFQPAHDAPAILQSYWQQLANLANEDRFYQLSALSHAYYYGGQTIEHALTSDWQTLPALPDNHHERIVPSTLTPLLQNWINHNYHPLLHYACQQLIQHRYTLPSNSLFSMIRYLQTQPNHVLTDYAPTTLLGVHGQWLLQQIGVSTSLSHSTPDDDWELTTFAQRKAWLAETRRHHPDHAREQLQRIWQTAPANHRQEYIVIMADNLNNNDHDFLTQALKDRSKNVKAEAQRLLLKLPNSPMVQQYQTWLAERLSYQPSQQTWLCHEQPFTADMKAAGIEEISPHKDESDSQYQLRQLIYALPLAAWANFLHTDEAQAANILVRNPPPIKNQDWETWLQKMENHNFNLTAIQHLNNTAKGRLSYYLTRLFMNLKADEQEALLQHTSFNPLSIIENLHYQQHFIPNTWGECYSHLVLDGLKHTKFYLSPEILMLIAIRLNPATSVVNAVDALTSFFANLSPEVQANHYYYGKCCTPLQEFFQQKQKFDAIIHSFNPAA